MLQKVKPISGYQFTAFRFLFGIYLAIHFVHLIPYGAEIFSREGMLPDASLNFTHGILPNPLEHWDTPGVVTGMLVLLAFLSLAFAAGFHRHICALLLWYGWACLFNRNNLISNPSIPYIGIILLLTLAIPAGEPLSLSRKRGAAPWFFPSFVYWTAWILMAVGYTFSGMDKFLLSPSWTDGTAMTHLVNNPLARPGPIRDLFLILPLWARQISTWFALGLEVTFLPLSLTRRTRCLAWFGMIAMHLGILTMVDFADLTMGMLMIHLFTFDPAWFPARRSETKSIVFYDGVCALCNSTMNFLIQEDRDRVLRFAPLQGETAAERIPAGKSQGDSIVFLRGDDVVMKSGAILAILSELGGFWRVVSWARIIPRALRDLVYVWIAKNRYRWFGQYDACRIPTAEVAEQLLP